MQSIEEKLKERTELEPICRVPLITSLKEEQALIASTDKVRFLGGEEGGGGDFWGERRGVEGIFGGF